MKKVVVMRGILVLAAVGFLGYQGHERSKQTELFEEASVYFKEEDYKKAIQLFEEAEEHGNIFSGSLNEEMLHYQAEAYMNLGEYEKAIEIYDHFIKEKPTESMNYMLKGYCYSQGKEYEKAAETYKEAYEKTGDGEFLLKLCNMYIATEDYEKALTLIEENRKTKDEESGKELLFSEVVIYEKQQDYASAYEKAKEYVEAYPDDEAGKKEMEFLESRQ